MIKYRQLCFWIAAVAATTSVGLAQKPPEQPAAPADAPAVSKTVTPAAPAVANEPAQPDPNSRLTTTSKKTSTTQNAKSITDPTKPARRIAIIELSPDTEKSEVILKSRESPNNRRRVPHQRQARVASRPELPLVRTPKRMT